MSEKVVDILGTEIVVGQMALRIDNKYTVTCQVCDIKDDNFTIGIKSAANAPIRNTHADRLIVEDSLRRTINWDWEYEEDEYDVDEHEEDDEG